jgi:N-acetylglucosamine kinase-like BadF-type ATPase
VLLAFDGGQSGLRGVLVGDGPSRTASVEGFSWTRSGDPVRQQADNVVAGWRALGSPARISVLAIGLAGGGALQAERIRLCELLGAALPVAEIRSTTDDVVTHLGALGGEPGVALAAGTGVLCIAIDLAGQRHNVDGLGYLFGDAGGGFWLGRKGMRAALAAVEGRGQATSLSRPLQALVGDLPGGVKRLYGSPNLVGQVAAFARVVADAALAGDAVAGALCRSAGAALASTAVAALGRSALELPVLLATAGGVLVEAGPVHAALVSELAHRSPLLRVVPAAGSALDGARELAAAASGGPGSVHLAMATVWRAGSGPTSAGSPDPGVRRPA